MTDEPTNAVIMTANCFVPTIIRVDEHATVTWFSHDYASHTVTGANASWGSFEEIAPASPHSETFDTAGVYPYYCFLHPGMIGAVVVGDGRGASPATGGSSDGTERAADRTLMLGLPAAAAVALTIGAGTFALNRRARRAPRP